ncbi:MAG: hypothetical protein JWN03_4621 [Nocardia sp.]|uniref:enoyl-CoA hydratase/isomerase family protein n=1 Tax=Nocardia sp. TaxID=1821 RepID=UPI00262B264F|nr:enoyl-CoA hydratase/isomerase family protein [Nocardia sp.]MCU1644346.1 hypothetical protein [Nocardia sp.]
MSPTLAFEPDLKIAPTGQPDQPMVLIPLDDLIGRPPEYIDTAAELLRRSLPLTVGILHSPAPQQLQPVLDALTCSLTAAPNSGNRRLVHVPDVDAAVSTLGKAVDRSPRASVACGQLLRQTSALDTAGALAAEAAVYSMLLGGTEFHRWLAERGTPRTRVAPNRPLVRLTRADDHLSIVLDHPERRNALSFRLREELLEALKFAAADPTVSDLEISGTGPSFCSGGDLDEFGTASDIVAAYLVRLARAPWRVLEQLSSRAIIQVHGGCIGAGAELASFGGKVIAAPDTFFEFPEVHMGLVPGAGGTVGVPRRIGRWRAAWLLLTGERLDAPAALDWGLVDAIAVSQFETSGNPA